MTASESLSFHPWNSAANDAEAELQQELRAMFEVDTQQYLQDYFSLVQGLSRQSWATDIQHLYRAVHTIKGGAVTVEADAMLHAGMVLEDLLSDLRYLEPSPDLADGQLSQMLLEAGELLSSSLEIQGTGETAIAQVQPTVQRIQTLHALIRQRYLPDWNELTQVHQEFAEQGFDLVVLELEMALNQLPSQNSIPPATRQTAQQTLDQLIQIGEDLQFAQSWGVVTAQCQTLIDQAHSTQWRQCWPEYFRLLKDCAKEGGKLNPMLQDRLAAIERCQTEAAAFDIMPVALEDLEAETPGSQALPLDSFFELEGLSEFGLEDLTVFTPPEHAPLQSEPDPAIAPHTATDLTEWLGELSLDDLSLPFALQSDLLPLNLEDAPLTAGAADPMPAIIDLPEFKAPELSLDEAEILSNALDEMQDVDPAAIADLDLGFDNLPTLSDLEAAELVTLDRANGLALAESLGVASTLDPGERLSQADVPPQIIPTAVEAAAPETAADSKRSIQVPVPLERLDQSAQQVVETLLTARGVSNISQKLQTQLAQITSLTQESAQFITRLRQLQDDYALLRNLSEDQDTSSNVTLERYRQGYTTINRLLENILRMSELGQEIETMTQQTSGRLDKLDRSIVRLKDSIETSRLVPFRNLSLRARAIVRDLSNRYGKPVELVVQGEQVELDAGILQQLEPALLHLLRNAYDHGLESVEDRLALGKPPQGILGISLYRRGNLYRLTLQDDGSGIDAKTIARLAQERGFALTQTRTAAELLAVLCQPGFSSRSTVTEVSGRGVGMDVVAGQIAAVNGKLSLETRPHQGTTFTIEVPAPQLLVPCVLLEVGERTIALPTDEILETVLLSEVQLSALETENPLLTWMLHTHRGSAPGFDLTRYWLQSEQPNPQPSNRLLSEMAIAIRTRSAEGPGAPSGDLWFIADDLLGQEELLINPLPSPLIPPAGLLGVSLQPDGRLISILDPMALTTAIQAAPITREVQKAHVSNAAPVQSASIKILVVDDAALMRRRLEASLTTAGFTIFTCADGLEAWNWLQTHERPDLMITDVEMPNMDGFTLIDRCRQSGLDLPILVVSSRLSEEWGKEARRLGASDYLNKGFSTPELLSKVSQLLSTAAVSLS